jgi:hypothetical protein
MEEFVVRIGVAEALADGIAPGGDPAWLSVRDILLDRDFRDQAGAAIARREWRLPVSGSYGVTGQDTQILQTDLNSQNDRKVFVFYGARLTGIFGPGRVGTETGTALGGAVGSASMGALAIASLTFKRGANIRTIDTWELEQLVTTIEGVVFARSPIVYKKNDPIRIDAWPKNGASGSADHLMILGKVIEPLGNTVNG